MTMAIALRIVLILLGCYLLVMTLLSLARRKMSEQFLPCMGIDVSADGFDRFFIKTFFHRTFYQCQRLYSDYNRTFWCFVGTLVYQYAGIHSDQKESGTGNSDFTFKSGYRTIVDRNRGI